MSTVALRCLVVSLLAVTLIGCGGQQADAEADAAAEVGQPDIEELRTEVLALEDAMNLAVDGLDCTTGMATMADVQPIFVSSGMVISTRAELAEMCEQMIAPRTGAVFSVDQRTAHMISDVAAVVVRAGNYTINYREQPSREVYLVMTTVWERGPDGWKMVHLHESAPPEPVG